MKKYKISDMTGGWYIGSFHPNAYFSDQFELNYRMHKAGEFWPTHYHKYTTEINLLINGKMKIQGQLLVNGDIFILEPFEIADPVFLEDCSIVCLKVPGGNDKVIVENL